MSVSLHSQKQEEYWKRTVVISKCNKERWMVSESRKDTNKSNAKILIDSKLEIVWEIVQIYQKRLRNTIFFRILDELVEMMHTYFENKVLEKNCNHIF